MFKTDDDNMTILDSLLENSTSKKITKYRKLNIFEKEDFKLLAGQGFRNSQIGRRLIISQKTISSFLSRDRIRSAEKLPVGRPAL